VHISRGRGRGGDRKIKRVGKYLDSLAAFSCLRKSLTTDRLDRQARRIEERTKESGSTTCDAPAACQSNWHVEKGWGETGSHFAIRSPPTTDRCQSLPARAAFSDAGGRGDSKSKPRATRVLEHSRFVVTVDLGQEGGVKRGTEHGRRRLIARRGAVFPLFSRRGITEDPAEKGSEVASMAQERERLSSNFRRGQ